MGTVTTRGPETASRIVPVAWFLAIFLLLLKKTSDTDAWMHLSLGRVIFQGLGLPANETFVYTALELPFLYSSWLFGLVNYLLYEAFGVSGIIVLKAATVAFCFSLVRMESVRGARFTLLANSLVMLAVGAVLLDWSSRLVERPEVAGAAFLMLAVLILGRYGERPTRLLYFIPPVVWLWANIHSSVVLVLLPLAAFVGGGSAQRLLGGDHPPFRPSPSWRQLGTVSVVAFLALLAGSLNPNGPRQFIFGREFLSIPFYRDEVVEFRPAFWAAEPTVFIFAALVLLLPLLEAWLIFTERRSGQDSRYPSPIVWITPLALTLLALQTARFGWILAVVAIPMVVRTTDRLIRAIVAAGERTGNALAEKAPQLLSAAAGVGILLLSGSLFRLYGADHGLAFDYRNVPRGAMEYLDSRGVAGRVFNKWEFGGYIVWRDYPRRSVFVDPRGRVDVETLELGLLAPQAPSVLADLHERFGFEALVLSIPRTVPTHLDVDAICSSPHWALVYWDDLAAVYLRRDGPHAATAAADEYRLLRPGNPSTISKIRAAAANPATRKEIDVEIQRALSSSDSVRARLFRGVFLSGMGDLEGASRELRIAWNKLDHPPGRTIVEPWTGIVGWEIGVTELARGNCTAAVEQFSLLEKVESFAAAASYNRGLCFSRAGELEKAVEAMRSSIAADPLFVPAHERLVALYRQMGDATAADALERSAAGNQRVAAARDAFLRGVASYRAGEMETARQRFERALELNPSSPVTLSNLGYLYFDSDRLDKAFEYQSRALALDPSHANAHYGLAMIYSRWGDRGRARRHWQEYIRLEPSGHFSRRAREELARLEG